MSAATRAATILAAAGAAGWTVHRLARRSGVTAGETRLSLPGDEIVARPLWESTRGITIDAPPAAVWPWIVQMGYPSHRAGWYTPHWLDELMWGERPRSADTVVPELQDLQVGDRVPDSDDWSVFYVVDQVEPGSHLVLHSTSHNVGPIETIDFSWAFALLPVAGDAGATRLLVRARVAYTPALLYPLVETVIGLGDWVNVSVMLRGIRERAERTPAGRPGSAQ
ncbi:MAG TPA: SRPBCC family protein [Thermoleophilia bacterium]|nr:SRPBCC family protein [Thermoleophilia bacterium]